MSDPRLEHQPKRSKRLPTPIFSTWLLQRRSAGFEPSSPSPKPEIEMDEDPPGSVSYKNSEVMNTIRKLQMWESALLRRFGDRFRDAPDQLAMNPLWVKVMKVRAVLHRLKAVVESQQNPRGLDTTRMK